MDRKENYILEEDLQSISDSQNINWNTLVNKSILVTGGTGLIGSLLIKALCKVNIDYNLNLNILSLVRDKDKSAKVLGEYGRYVNHIIGTVEELPYIKDSIDYIIHGASPTSSLFFIQHPVETIRTSVLGTMNLLNLAKKKNVDSFLYLSSMEVYGTHLNDKSIVETYGCSLDSMNIRNCYPIAKRLCENLCASYTREYGIPAKAIRLSQTFGPGVLSDDKRLFAEIARSVISKKDIVLQTDGMSKRSYLYTADAVLAILTVLLNGENSNVYNACNPDTYCSIVDMAHMIVKELTNDTVKVRVLSQSDIDLSKYPPSHYLNLDITKLRSLGWEPTIGLKDMYIRMISGMVNEI